MCITLSLGDYHCLSLFFYSTIVSFKVYRSDLIREVLKNYLDVAKV